MPVLEQSKRPVVVQMPPPGDDELQMKFALQLAMAADGHKQMWNPDLLVVEKNEDGEASRILGCAGIGTVPYVNVWLDSQRVKARETVKIIARFEEIARERGFNIVAVPCADGSPLFPYMEKLGYTRASRPTFIKVLPGRGNTER